MLVLLFRFFNPWRVKPPSHLHNASATIPGASRTPAFPLVLVALVF